MTVVPPRLDEPIVASGSIRSVNFFNGRLLTGDDLQREQAADRARLARLGEAVGEGVVTGLEVEPILHSPADNPVVTVRAGLAVARSGIVLDLPVDTDLSLVREGPRPGSEREGLFADCEPPAGGTYTAGSGVYLLCVGPASKGEGLAPVSGLHNQPSACNVAYSVEAVRFRLIRLALPSAELTDEARLRNRVAYQMFGSDDLGALERDPFGAPLHDWGLMARVRANCLDDDELPLATIGWKANAGIRFIDLWSVRRRVSRGSASAAWPGLAGERRRVEGEARLLQFQAQIRERALTGSPAAVRAQDCFEQLPPVGLLPLSGSVSGYSVSAFFSGMTIRGPYFMPGARVERLLDASIAFPPIRTAAKELVWLYDVRENHDFSVQGAGLTRPYVVFASGFMPYAGQPHFDLSRFNYANYALSVS